MNSFTRQSQIWNQPGQQGQSKAFDLARAPTLHASPTRRHPGDVTQGHRSNREKGMGATWQRPFWAAIVTSTNMLWTMLPATEATLAVMTLRRSDSSARHTLAMVFLALLLLTLTTVTFSPTSDTFTCTYVLLSCGYSAVLVIRMIV